MSIIRRIGPYRGQRIFFDRPGKRHPSTPPEHKTQEGQLPDARLLSAQAIHLDSAELAPTQDTLFKLLEEKMYEIPDVRRIGIAFEHFQNLDAKKQEKNIWVALLLAEWGAYAPAIMAALLMGAKIPTVLKNEKLAEIIENKDDLAQLKTPALSKKGRNRWVVTPGQPELFADLLFLKCKRFESILLLAAEDLIDLEHFANDPKIQKNHNKIDRAFFVTAQILRNFGFGLQASKLEDAALLLGTPTIRKVFAGDLKSIQEKGEAASPQQLYFRQRIEGLNRLKEVMAFVNRSLAREDSAKDQPGFNVEIKGRRKGILSADQKEGNTPDTFAMRIIELTDYEGNCYLILSQLKNLFLKERKTRGENWKEIKDRYDDWIDNPKDNRYQSIHLYFKEQSGFIVEIQIRTKQMDKTAEHGTAAHCLYKAAKNAPGRDYQSVIQMARDNFIKRKGELLINRGSTIVYDANGKLVELTTDNRRTRPNLIDFAFKQDAEAGLRVQSGTVNGKRVRLETPLETGQVVVIQTTKSKKKRNIAQVNTTFARALLRAKTNKMFREPKEYDEDRLVEIGTQKLRKIKESIVATLGVYIGESAIRPSLIVPEEFLLAGLNCRSLREVYIALALLQKMNSFERDMRSLLLKNLVIASQKPSRKRLALEFLVTNEGGAFSAILEMISNIDITNYKLYMYDFVAEPVLGTAYSRITLKFNIREGSEEVDDVVEHLKLERPYSQDAKQRSHIETRTAQITLEKGLNLFNTMTDILEILKKFRVNIQSGSIASRGTNGDDWGSRERSLSFDIQIPKTRKQREFHRRLIKQIKGIDGVKSFKSSAAPR